MKFDFIDRTDFSAKDEDCSLLYKLNKFLADKLGKESTKVECCKNLLQELYEQGKVITSYRDKMLVERSIILNDYANKNPEKGTMYYVYSKRSKDDSVYNLCICGSDNANKVISVKCEELPEDIQIGCVLRCGDDGYFVDRKATEFVSDKIEEMIQRLLIEQEQELTTRRIEGNIYEVVEASGKIVTLMNITKNDGECFEDVVSMIDCSDCLNPGTRLQYENNVYKNIQLNQKDFSN